MPIYEYSCQNCGHDFEELVVSSRQSDAEIKCPECGQKQAKRKLSLPSIGHSDRSGSTGASCGSSGFT